MHREAAGLEPKVCVITGAGSGLDMAAGFARRGATVVGLDRQRAGANAIAHAVGTADRTRIDLVKLFIEHRAVDRVGPVDHQRRQLRKQNPATALTSHNLESTTPSRPESPPVAGAASASRRVGQNHRAGKATSSGVGCGRRGQVTVASCSRARGVVVDRVIDGGQRVNGLAE